MTVHETELTFLRCPGCRSLVPPSATRCRMCGEALTPPQAQNNDAAQQESAEAKKSRVRQRTMSLPPEEVEGAKEQFLKGEPEELPPSRVEQAKPAERMNFASPPPEPERSAARSAAPFKLGAQPQPPAPPSRPAASESTVSEHVSIAERITKGLESDLEREAPVRKAEPRQQDAAQKVGFRLQMPPIVAESEEPEDHEEEGEDDGDDEDEMAASPDATQAPRKKRRRRRKKKKGDAGLATPVMPATTDTASVPFRAERSERVEPVTPQAAVSTPPIRPAMEPVATPVTAAPLVATTVREIAPEAPRMSAPPVRDVAPAAEPAPAREAPPVRESAPQVARAEQQATQQSARTVSQPQRGKAVDPRTQPALDDELALVGWFVNFENDKKGVATEIRGGRFFVCGERLKDTDMVVSDATISTPHCVVKAQAGAGLRVQDLLSEKGTFVRKSGEDKFYQYSESMEVNHGDWLRFGDYEVLVCLVSYPKKR